MMNKNNLKRIGAFLLLIAIFCTFQNFTDQDEVTVFRSSSGDTNIFYRIPALITLNSKEILFAFAEERVGNKNYDHGNINVVYKMSFDHGKTWSRQYKACNYIGTDKRDGTCGNPTVTIDQASGYIHLFMNANNRNIKQQDVTLGDRRVLYMRGRYDQNIKKIRWSRRLDLTNVLGIRDSHEPFDIVGPGTGIVYDNPRSTKHRRVIVPAVRRNFYSDNASKVANVEDIIWRKSNIFSSRTSTETSLVQLPSNNLYRNDRMSGHYNNDDPDAVYCGDNRNRTNRDVPCRTRRMVSIVKNLGANVSSPLPDPRLLDPKAQGSLYRYTKNNIFAANCSSGLRRKNLRIRRSSGHIPANLDARKLHLYSKSILVDRDCGYSSMSKTRDYNLAIIYEKSSRDSHLSDLFSKRLIKAPKDIVFKKYPLRAFE